MDLMKNWVDIEVEKVNVCVICGVRTVKVWVTLGDCLFFSEHHALFLEHLKNNLEEEFEHFKSLKEYIIYII